jgi:hypothetical protein
MKRPCLLAIQAGADVGTLVERTGDVRRGVRQGSIGPGGALSRLHSIGLVQIAARWASGVFEATRRASDRSVRSLQGLAGIAEETDPKGLASSDARVVVESSARDCLTAHCSRRAAPLSSTSRATRLAATSLEDSYTERLGLDRAADGAARD